MSIARMYPMLFGRYLVTPEQLQNLQDTVRDMAFDEGAAKGRHMAAVAWGKLGGLTQKKNIVVTPTPPTFQRISTREATVMAQLRAVKKEYAASRFDLPLPTIAQCVAQYRDIPADRDEFVTATVIGKAMYPQLQPWQVYKLFEKEGWVVRIKAGWVKGQYIRAGWQITESGKRYGKSLEYRTAYDQHVTGIHWRKDEVLSVIGTPCLVA